MQAYQSGALQRAIHLRANLDVVLQLAGGVPTLHVTMKRVCSFQELQHLKWMRIHLPKAVYYPTMFQCEVPLSVAAQSAELTSSSGEEPRVLVGQMSFDGRPLDVAASFTLYAGRCCGFMELAREEHKNAHSVHDGVPALLLSARMPTGWPMSCGPSHRERRVVSILFDMHQRRTILLAHTAALAAH
tara:strand:+ start:569 stop:1129 length:561 start_codon:yes stop_codon:yes gene_type:complete